MMETVTTRMYPVPRFMIVIGAVFIDERKCSYGKAQVDKRPDKVGAV